VFHKDTAVLVVADKHGSMPGPAFVCILSLEFIKAKAQMISNILGFGHFQMGLKMKAAIAAASAFKNIGVFNIIHVLHYSCRFVLLSR
jgi:hypothetical protein